MTEEEKKEFEEFLKWKAENKKNSINEEKTNVEGLSQATSSNDEEDTMQSIMDEQNEFTQTLSDNHDTSENDDEDEGMSLQAKMKIFCICVFVIAGAGIWIFNSYKLKFRI